LQEYRTTALLGCSTDTFDSQGSIVSYAPYSHLSPSAIESVLSRFRGEILQYPPIYSALKMDGKPLYEYARNGEKLPRPIEPRKVIVHELVLESWQEGKKEGAGQEDKGHGFRWPEKKMTQEERELADTAARLVREAEAAESQASSASLEAPASSTAESHVVPPTSQSSPPQPDDFSAPTSTPPAFTLRMTVSSGTYVRSIVHDIALALNSAAHVVVLQRTRQGEFSLPDASTGAGGDCVSWDLFQQAVDERQEERKAAGLWGGEKGKGSQKKIAAQKVFDVEEDEEMMGNDETPVEVAKPAGDGLKAWELALLSKFRPS
jgi:tRNA pseudouridine55 synthase